MKGPEEENAHSDDRVGAVALALSTALIGYAMRDGINFFRSPSQVADPPPPPTRCSASAGWSRRARCARAGRDGQLSRDRRRRVDPRALPASCPTSSARARAWSAPADVDGVFEATEILARHDETYMPAEVIDALKEQGVYVDPEGANAVRVRTPVLPKRINRALSFLCNIRVFTIRRRQDAQRPRLPKRSSPARAAS
jgi:cytochrome c-type biogenesis protein CcmE